MFGFPYADVVAHRINRNFTLKENEQLAIKETDRVGIVINQILVGAVSGVIGFILFALFEQTIFGRLDLFGSILYALAFGYAAMYFGIAVYSYFRFRELLTRVQLLRMFYFTFPALVLTLYLFLYSNWKWSWEIGFLTLLYSVIGLIWGFSRTTLKDKQL